MNRSKFKEECLSLCGKLKANPKVRHVKSDNPTHFWVTDNIQDNNLRVFITYIYKTNSMFVEIDSTYNAMLAREDNGQRVFNTHAIKEDHTVEGTTKSKLTSMADKSNHPERFHNLIYDMFN